MLVRHAGKRSGTCTILTGIGCPIRMRSRTPVRSASSGLRERIGWVIMFGHTREEWRNRMCVRTAPRASRGKRWTSAHTKKWTSRKNMLYLSVHWDYEDMHFLWFLFINTCMLGINKNKLLSGQFRAGFNSEHYTVVLTVAEVWMLSFH